MLILCSIDVACNRKVCSHKSHQMKHIVTVASLILTTVIGSSLPTTARTLEKQTSKSETACIATTPAEQLTLNAAKNEARQMAEFTNGGLNVYRAEPAMHGAAIASPCEMLGPTTWRFVIRGGEPTAVAVAEEYTTLSVIIMEGIGRDRIVTVIYNGPIAGYGQLGGTSATPG